MSERPIIFSAPMIRAILGGTKSMTRRVVKIKNLDFVGGGPRDGADWNDPSCWGFEDCNTGRNWALASGDDVDDIFACPYGLPGDRLWVRETWAQADRPLRDDGRGGIIAYRAAYPNDQVPQLRWRSSIHMPRDRSRITLEITGVRVERLQDISEDDAIAEGVDAISLRDIPRQATRSRRADFAQIWGKIHGAGSWAANPWVWVVAFRRVA